MTIIFRTNSVQKHFLGILDPLSKRQYNTLSSAYSIMGLRAYMDALGILSGINFLCKEKYVQLSGTQKMLSKQEITQPTMVRFNLKIDEGCKYENGEIKILKKIN